MADIPQPQGEVLNETELLEALRQVREGVEGVEAQLMLGHLVGQVVDIRAIDQGNEPITAYYYATPYPLFGTPGYRPQHGLLLRPHPHRAQGTVEEVDFTEAKLKVKPRSLSPYRFDGGYFIVDMFDDEGEPLVSLDLKA